MFWGPVAMSAGTQESEGGSPYIILETAVCAPEIAFFKVVTTLDLTSEQSTTEWAVRGQKGVMAEQEGLTSRRRQQSQVLCRWLSLSHGYHMSFPERRKKC